jgi:hypothetical protein
VEDSVPAANIKVSSTHRVRAGWEHKWSAANFDAISSDEALLRLADARNAASKSANRFMLLAALLAAFYFIRFQGISVGYQIGGYNLEKLPFGLFVLTAAALALSSAALIRTGDSRSFDRTLLLACEKRFECDCELRYLAFPNEHAWGEAFSRMLSAIDAGPVAKILRHLSLLATSLFLLFLAVLPALSGTDFLVGNRAWLGNNHLSSIG